MRIVIHPTWSRLNVDKGSSKIPEDVESIQDLLVKVMTKPSIHDLQLSAILPRDIADTTNSKELLCALEYTWLLTTFCT